MSLIRLSLRGKIVLTIIAVTAVVVILGAWKAAQQVREAEARGTYLERPLRRYIDTAAQLGAGEYAVCKLAASDGALTAALAGADAGVIAEAARRLGNVLSSSLPPDLFVISDESGRVFGLPGVPRVQEAEWKGHRLFQDLREGRSVRARFSVFGQKGYRVSAAAVRNGEKFLGVVLFGASLEKWFSDVAARSHTDVERQHRLTLVVDDRIIAASSLPREQWNPFLEAIRRPTKIEDGREGTPALIIDKNTTYDYAKAPLYGYSETGDPDTAPFGNLYLTRSHEFQRAETTDDRFLGIVLVLAAAMLFSILVGFWLAYQITRPLNRYIVATTELSRGQGDLGKRLPVQTRDELGVLASNLNRVFAKIHSLAASVQRSAFQVNTSSAEISSMSRKTLDGAKEQAAKITSSTAAVTELSSSIQQVAENAAEATRTAKQSGEAVTRAIERLQRIRSTVEEAATRIGALGESGKRIGNIVEVIRQISEQTSMLALNAAIEAAHAGEHGRGFAVVADEVSSLAKRTGQSARDIEDLIAAIRDQTGEAVQSMQLGTREVEEGTTLVERTLADLKTLISVIDDTAAAVQEQAIASDEIARNMDAVQRIAGHVVSSSETAVSQGERLQRLAEDLEQSVRGFKIDPERVALDEAELRALPEPRA